MVQVEALLRGVRSHGSRLLALFIVPLVMAISYHTIPDPTKTVFALDARNPDLLAVIATAYTFPSFQFFMGTFVAYFLVIIPAYLLYTNIDSRRTFWHVYAILTLITPSINSIALVLFVAIQDPTRALPTMYLGYSGVISAYLVLTLYAVYKFGYQYHSRKMGLRVLAAAIGVSLGFGLGAAGRVSVLTSALIISIAFLQLAVVFDITQPKRLFNRFIDRPHLFFIFVYVLALLSLLMRGLIPSTGMWDPLERIVINSVHISGLLTGLIVISLYEWTRG